MVAAIEAAGEVIGTYIDKSIPYLYTLNTAFSVVLKYAHLTTKRRLANGKMVLIRLFRA